MKQNNFQNAKNSIYLFVLLVTVSIIFLKVTSTANATILSLSALGDYPDTTMQLGRNTVVIPTNPPVNVVSVTGITTTDFKGQLAVDSNTGAVRVTNAFPAGSYTVTVTAFDDNGGKITKNFNLTVQASGLCSQTNFKQFPAFDASRGPQSIAVEDFDGDGKQDIATTGIYSDGVSILRNISTIGSSNFAQKIDFSISSAALGITVADFDGDGKKDIVTANFFNPSISVLRNISTVAGEINFAPKVDFSVGSSPRSVAVADFDGDGKIDIVVANNGSNNVSVLKNTSIGEGVIGFGAAINITVGSQPRSVAVGDFNGDNKTDIATANYFSDTVSVLRNTSAGTISFATKTDFAVGSYPGSNPNSLVAGDFNGDGKTDIATTHSGGVSVLRNTNTNPAIINFAPKLNFTVGFGAYSIVAKDLDNDGKQDLATANYYGNTLSVLRNNSNINSISFELRREFGVGLTPTAVASADFDGDGKNDLAVSNSKSDNVSILRNTVTEIGTVQFDARNEYGLSASAYNPFSIAVGDFDRDGKQDLVTANYSGNISILKNLGTLGGNVIFSPSMEFSVGTGLNPYWLAVQDFDGDGKQDVVVTNSSSNRISILRNTSTELGIISFASSIEFTVGNNPSFVATADFDHDGKYDIAVANYDSNNVSILKNTGTTVGSISFAAKIDLPIDSNASSLTISDFNADGKSDIAVTNRISTKVSVFRNLSVDNGTISFAPKIDFSVNSQPLFITSEDFDGDGKTDLAVTNFLEPNGIVSILRNISNNGENINFASKVDFAITSRPEFNMIPGHIVTGDINKDGKSDIIVINSALQVVSLLKNSSNALGNINFETRIDAFTSVATSSLAVGDFDQNGRLDIAFSSYNSNNVGVLENPCVVPPTKSRKRVRFF